MADHAPETLDQAAPYAPSHGAGRARAIHAPPVPTPYESLLTWLVLTLLGVPGAPPPARSAPVEHTRARPSAAPYGALLTTREVEVLGLVTLGLTNAQIAEHLCVSRRTIDQHLASIYNRLGVSSRAAATRLAMLSGLCA